MSGAISVIFSQTASNTIANTGTETELFGTGSGTRVFGANQLYPGATIRVKLAGVLSTALVGPSLRIRVKLGGATVLDSTAATLLGSISARRFELDCDIEIREFGSSAVVFGSGTWIHNTGDVTGIVVEMPGTSQTIDSTTTNTLSVTAQWGTASASNTITSLVGYITHLNAP